MPTRLPRSSEGSATGGLSRVPYLPGLDGLRAIAVVGVMLYHANHDWLPGGYLGVEVFFVLSGYLITLLLMGEQERTGRVDLVQFWKRRFRRLLPALFVMMALVGVYVTGFYTAARYETRGDFLGGILYVSNWYQIFVGQGYGSSEAFVPLRHLWSLAVEEQFYVLWPLVMVALLRRSRGRLPSVGVKLLAISLGIAAITALLFHGGDVNVADGKATGFWSIAGRLVNTNDLLYLNSFSRAGGLMLGAGFAMLWRPMAVIRGPLRDKARRLDLLAFGGIAVLVYLMVTMWLTEKSGSVYNPWLFRGGFLLTGLATLLVVAAATHQKAITGPLLGNKVMLWIGTRSYGLYLYHWPVYQVIRKQANIQLTVAELVTAMVVTIPLTELSYQFIETPIRKGHFGEVLGRLRRDGRTVVASLSVAVVVALAAYSMIGAGPQCVGSVRCSLVESTTAVDGSSSGTDTTVPDGSGTTATTVKAAPKKFVAIGESVMAGARIQLETGGVSTDAKEGRGPEGVKNGVIKLEDLGYIGTGTKIVIHVGTNARMSAAEVAAIMAEVPSDAGTVYFITLHGDISWVPANNELIRSLPATYPNVQIIDWDSVAGQVTLCSDGVHLTCDSTGQAAKFYANTILTAVGAPTI